MNSIKILVGCEESQVITKSFRNLGYEAYSCDLKEPSGGHPEWHLQMDVFEAIDLVKPKLGIFNPPCTFVTGSGVQWLSHPEDSDKPFDERRPHPKHPNRRADMLESIEFVKALYNSDIPYVAIENPIGILSTRWRKPDQIIQPWMFGDLATKGTCLWLKGLPKLIPAITEEPEMEYYTWNSKKDGKVKRMQKWMYDIITKSHSQRSELASKTFKGIADAMANQWIKTITDGRI